MIFRFTNEPEVFQRLMQKVLVGLNPEGGPDYVIVYLDVVVVFFHTLNDYLEYLRCVVQRIQDAGLKLKHSKCQFMCKEVQYCRHWLLSMYVY